MFRGGNNRGGTFREEFSVGEYSGHRTNTQLSATAKINTGSKSVTSNSYIYVFDFVWQEVYQCFILKKFKWTTSNFTLHIYIFRNIQLHSNYFYLLFYNLQHISSTVTKNVLTNAQSTVDSYDIVQDSKFQNCIKLYRWSLRNTKIPRSTFLLPFTDQNGPKRIFFCCLPIKMDQKEFSSASWEPKSMKKNLVSEQNRIYFQSFGLGTRRTNVCIVYLSSLQNKE